MPATIAVPLAIGALGAASKYGAATSGAKAAREAAAAQERSTAAALEYQKSRDAIGDADRKMRWDAYQRDLAEWKARRGYGGGATGATGGTPSSMHPVAVAAREAVMRPGYSARSAQPTLRDLAPTGKDVAAATVTPDQDGSMTDFSMKAQPTIRDLRDWSEWDPYLGAQG